MDTGTTLYLNTDAQIQVDPERTLFGWRQERMGRVWVDPKLLPLDETQAGLLLSFRAGASVADALAQAPGQEDFIRKCLELGVLVEHPGDRGRPDDRFVPLDFDEEFKPLYRDYRAYTLTSVNKMYALYKAVRYLIDAGVSGDIAESGVWRGGSMMITAQMLKDAGDTDRKIYLYDTYKGMSAPTDKDVFYDDKAWLKEGDLAISLEEVQANMATVGYPEDKLVYIKGKCEDTLPAQNPDGPLAMLRIDTDFYEPIYQSLVHLYPLLVSGGALVLDDYGSMKGAKEAVDTYFRESGQPILLTRVERGAVGTKP